MSGLSKSAVERAPVEIWRTILLQMIAVPIFLDVDPADHYGIDSINQYYFEFAYWQSERDRNSARRVCSSWNDLLSSFDHRLVRMTDVDHGHVPAHAIPRAIRLDLRPCECSECTVSSEDRMPPTHLSDQRRLQRLEYLYITAPDQEWSTKILHGHLYDGTIGEMAYIAKAAPRLKALVDQEETAVVQAVKDGRLRDLRVLLCSMPVLWMDPNDWLALSFERVTTLQTTVSSLRVCKDWQLPAIQHLGLTIENNTAAVDTEMDDLVSLLSRVGSTIRTFYWTGITTQRHWRGLPNHFWTLCPRLESLETPLYIFGLIPSDHPLSSVRLDIWGIRFEEWDASRLRVPPAFCGAFPQITLKLRVYWYFIVAITSAHWRKRILDKIEQYALQVNRVVDKAGMCLEEYLVFLIRAGRHRRLRTYPPRHARLNLVDF